MVERLIAVMSLAALSTGCTTDIVDGAPPDPGSEGSGGGVNNPGASSAGIATSVPWLYIRAIDDLAPDAEEFPNFDAALRTALKAETATLFQEAALGGLPEGPAVETATLRERLELHRSSVACSGCHQLMDPIGFGLENFDAVGAYRTMDGPHPIDSSGQLSDGRTFSGAAELANLIAEDSKSPAASSKSYTPTRSAVARTERQDTWIHTRSRSWPPGFEAATSTSRN